MQTAGIGLAAEDTSTAVVWIRWTATGAMLDELIVGAGDDELLRAASAADKAGIDCPLGWPELFVECVIANHRGELTASIDPIGRDCAESGLAPHRHGDPHADSSSRAQRRRGYAVVAALTARAAAIGQATRPGPADMPAETTESRIALPTTSLSSLTTSSAKG